MSPYPTRPADSPTPRTPRAVIEEALAEASVAEDGRQVDIVLSPGLDDAAIAKIEEELGAKLPPDIEELLRFTRAIEIGGEPTIGFDGGFSFGLEHILPRVIPLANDGTGFYWGIEVQPDGTWGPVFYAAEELSIAARDLTEFLCGRLSFEDDFDDFADDAATSTSDVISSGVPAHRLDDADDETLRAFAKELGPDDLVFDLRAQVVGSSVPIFLHGADGTTVKRCGDALVFAVVTPPKPSKKPSLLRRLFGA